MVGGGEGGLGYGMVTGFGELKKDQVEEAMRGEKRNSGMSVGWGKDRVLGNWNVDLGFRELKKTHRGCMWCPWVGIKKAG